MAPAPPVPPIELIPIGAVERPLLTRLAGALAEAIRTEASVGEALEGADAAFDAGRGQHAAAALVDLLVARGGAAWRLGVAGWDLFDDGLAFVFGQATLGGCCAVVALPRLRRDADEARFFERVLKEAVHELGHVAGLGHCPDPACVMSFSRSLAEVDAKALDFCADCRAGRVATEG